MPSKVIIAAAGSGKTELIVEEALAVFKRTLILTYTNENLDVIRERILGKHGYIPEHLKISGWYSFLLKEAVRPYQNVLYNGPRVSTLNFEPVSDNMRRIPKANTNGYYFTKSGNIHRDRVSDFAFECNRSSSNMIIRRLEKMYDKILVDEVQDMAGWDLEFLNLLLQSSIELIFVGDIRQATYSTNNSSKNSQFKGSKIIKWFELQKKYGRCQIEVLNHSHRCNQQICDFADALYPYLEKTISLNKAETGHDGIFFIHDKEALGYIAKYSPKVLRQDKNVIVSGSHPLNFGMSKGQTFDRVLIYPTNAMKEYFDTGLLSKVVKGETKPAFDIAKLYVALTRARYSAAIVHTRKVNVTQPLF